jgi:hypothetical protein
MAWGEREGEDGAVNLEGRRLGEALTDEGEWRRGSGEVRRGPESSGRWRWAGGRGGVGVPARPRKKREGGEKETGCGARRHGRFIPARGGGRRAMGVAPRGRRGPRERGVSRLTGGRHPIGSGPRPAATGGVARPCRAAGGPNRGGGGLTDGPRPQRPDGRYRV